MKILGLNEVEKVTKVTQLIRPLKKKIILIPSPL